MQNQEQQAGEEVEEREPTLEELGLHSHCLSCILKRCHVSVEPGVSCSHIFCPFQCGAYFHQCKADDHSTICPNVKTECLNSELGCQSLMRRALCVSHLQQCPAHIVMCGQSMARDEYENHFCGEHDHQCEPVLQVWREEQAANREAGEEENKKKTEEYKKKMKEKKLGGGGGGGDETDSASSKAVEETKSSTSETKAEELPTDPLHTVPWQLNNDAEEGEGDGDAPLSPVPQSPAPFDEKDLKLNHLPYGVLQEIGEYLDRETLHELALTSKPLRYVAASLLKKKGLVETRWKKEDGKWMENGRIWRYIPAHLKPDT